MRRPIRKARSSASDRHAEVSNSRPGGGPSHLGRWTATAAGSIAVVALLAAAGACTSEDEPSRPDILFLTIDTLRADHLSSYGYPRATSPVLDRLAAEGVRFDQAAVQWPKTGPSFASMLTATYPKNNGIVRKVGIQVPNDFHLLAEEMAARGYQTHAVVSNGALGADFQFDQGFESYVETWKRDPPEPGGDANGAAAVTAWATGLLDRIVGDGSGENGRRRPYFFWVHYLDPHAPYRPPPAYRDRFQDDEHFDPSQKVLVDATRERREMGGIGTEQAEDGRDDLAFYLARYDAEIAYADAEIGKLLDTMRGRGLLENVVTVVTSDHGESLGEHGYYFDHGRFAFQTCLRVPFIVHFPGRIAAGVDPDPVQLIDLAPTLLEFAGVELDGGRWMQGRSLAGRLVGRRLDPTRPAYAFSEAGYGRQHLWQRVVRDRRYKLIDAAEGHAQRIVAGEVGKQFALFDLVEDPAETRNLFDERPEVAASLRQVLGRWYDQPFDAIAGVEGEVGEMDQSTREQLKALGYLQ